MRYLKGMGYKFLLRWLLGLVEVVFSIYYSWRRYSISLFNLLLRDCSNKYIKVGWAGGFERVSIRLGLGRGIVIFSGCGVVVVLNLFGFFYLWVWNLGIWEF